ncbi:MAG: DNA-processing protein DprA [Patescibacteria group bacterium]
MIVKKLKLNSPDYPEVLRNIVDPPEQLYHTGAPLEELLRQPSVAIVGTRRVSPYGKQVTMQLARELAEQGIVVISGLALGVDCLAHKAALDAGGQAIAVLPSPLEAIAPATNRHLAQEILDKGGALVSEYASGTHPVKQYFIARNRIVSGLADALLITEAAEKSGSLHTANFALDQGKTVMAVPGNVTSEGAVGVNNLVKTGATPVTSYADVMHVLGLKPKQQATRAIKGRNDNEQTILDLLIRGIMDGHELLDKSRLTASQFAQVLTMLELGGKIRSLGGNKWGIY